MLYLRSEEIGKGYVEVVACWKVEAQDNTELGSIRKNKLAVDIERNGGKKRTPVR